ncbi:MAG: type II toxin-antitoxin system VapC family toxin, partial [Okeania sp. SIO2H7]|nr:type II toxin-antitoxin system VapC family toxin [Okeania sp. SIO2H7]
MLLDSNIIIYSVQPENARLRQFIAEQEPAVSALSYLEVLGYHQLTADDRLYFNEFFEAARIIPISQAVIEQAVILRQQRRISIGDAIIAGTAIQYNMTLVTRNTEDFQWITELAL